MEVFICDAADLPGGPEGTVIQSCFNKYPLDRAPDDENEGGPIDPENPGRFFLDPPCRAEETDQEMVPGATTGAVATARYLLPKDLTCKHCTVQMVYCESYCVYVAAMSRVYCCRWSLYCEQCCSDHRYGADGLLL